METQKGTFFFVVSTTGEKKVQDNSKESSDPVAANVRKKIIFFFSTPVINITFDLYTARICWQASDDKVIAKVISTRGVRGPRQIFPIKILCFFQEKEEKIFSLLCCKLNSRQKCFKFWQLMNKFTSWFYRVKMCYLKNLTAEEVCRSWCADTHATALCCLTIKI